MVHIAIADKGVGIPPEEIGHVARRFVRGRNAGGSGSGLGLAIAKRVVTDHDGRFSIESRLGEGTTVNVALPMMEI
jgi:two-component system phosphate regulon sensor histidine kinase PhoR